MALFGNVMPAVPHGKAAISAQVVSVPDSQIFPRLYPDNRIDHRFRISIASHYGLTMCDFLVFAACDVTPEHWADFSKTAELKEEIIGKKDPTADPRPPYVLVYSRSQEDFSRTGDLSEQVKTGFSSATYADMYAFIATIPEVKKTSMDIEPVFFMVLDKKSEEDRKVVLISKSLASLYIDEENEDEVTDDVADDIIWRKHRIPFEKACFFWLVLLSKPGDEGDEFLQNTTSETAN